MTHKLQKSIVVPLDGSHNALAALDYLAQLFGPKHELKISLLHIVSGVPVHMVKDSHTDRELLRRLKQAEKANEKNGAELLAYAANQLLSKGFGADQIETVAHKKETGVARDICTYGEKALADAILLSTRGKSRLEALFLGETAVKVLEGSRFSPVWFAKGKVARADVLVAVDGSEGAMRAVDHVGFMLAGTDHKVTLFHAISSLRRFAPAAVFDQDPDLEQLWQSAAGKKISPFMQKARTVLEEAGLAPSRIHTQVVEGMRSPAKEVLKAAQKLNCGTIVMGRRGQTNAGHYSLGGITRKVFEQGHDMALWIVL